MKATADVWNRENIEKKLGAPISEEQYHMFVEPFEGISRLNTIRSLIKPEEIVEPPKVHTPVRVADFPEDMPFSKDENASFKAVHKLLSSIKQSSLNDVPKDVPLLS